MGRHPLFVILKTHALFDRPGEARKSNVKLVGKKLADGPNPPVTEMVDVIGIVACPALAEADQVLVYNDKIIADKNRRILGIAPTL